MEKTGIVHDGVSIKIYDTEDPEKVIISFTDEITAYKKIKKAVIKGKGKYCNGISCEISRRRASSRWKSSSAMSSPVPWHRGWGWKKASFRENLSTTSVTSPTYSVTL